jgi:branched-chain amino acid transport system ATP-binding protein
VSETPLLVANGLAMHFGGVRVLQGIDFTVRRRELRCVIGPNGAGKSTLFKCLTGQLMPSAGTILFKGEPIVGLPSFDIAQRGVGIKTQCQACSTA